MDDKSLQSLLQKKLSNAEMPVDPSIWQGVSGQLGATGSAGAASGAAASGSLGLTSWVAIVITAVTIGGGLMYLASSDTPENPTETTVSSPSESENNPQNKTPLKTEKADENRPAMEEESAEVAPMEENMKEQRTERRTEQVIGTDPAADTITLETVTEVRGNATQNDAQAPKEKAEADQSLLEATDPEQTEEVSSQPTIGLSAQFSAQEDLYDPMGRDFSPGFDEGVKYIWFFGDGTTSQEKEPRHTYAEEGTFDVSLRVIGPNGFEVEETRAVEVYLPAQLVLPNVFTPNGDGRNDYLTLSEGSRKISLEKMMVYDSNGTLVFEQIGAGPGWDGVDRKGNQCVKGTYRMIVVARSNSGQQFNESQMVRLQR